MRQSGTNLKTENDLSHFFSEAVIPSQQEMLGQVVFEILRTGKTLNRKTLCVTLLKKLELASEPEQKQHYYALIGLLFGRDN
jgi:hypothetical protein